MQPEMQVLSAARPANMMSFMDATKTCLQQYVGFSGRASRSEYWWFVLVTGIAGFVASMLDGIIFGFGLADPTWINTAVSLGLFLPTIAVAIRRIHDQGKSGWFILVPFYNLYLLIVDGEAHDNAHGAVPTNTL
ncbi:MAG: DUF805 domain-containing protein [Candidatus Poseidoniaceae archaeon]|nr:DUF805 domain-containing protein [Candidatus Poseidoniaceae archaeon]